METDINIEGLVTDKKLFDDNSNDCEDDGKDTNTNINKDTDGIGNVDLKDLAELGLAW